MRLMQNFAGTESLHAWGRQSVYFLCGVYVLCLCMAFIGTKIFSFAGIAGTQNVQALGCNRSFLGGKSPTLLCRHVHNGCFNGFPNLHLHMGSVHAMCPCMSSWVWTGSPKPLQNHLFLALEAPFHRPSRARGPLEPFSALILCLHSPAAQACIHRALVPRPACRPQFC